MLKAGRTKNMTQNTRGLYFHCFFCSMLVCPHGVMGCSVKYSWESSRLSQPGAWFRMTDGPCGTYVTDVSTVEYHAQELSSSSLGTSPYKSDDSEWTIVKSRKKVSKNNSVRDKSKWKVSMDYCSGCDHEHD